MGNQTHELNPEMRGGSEYGGPLVAAVSEVEIRGELGGR